MFNRTRRHVKADFDAELLDLIHATKASWDHAQETENAVYESEINSELAMSTALQRQKYMYLFREARRRKIRG